MSEFSTGLLFGQPLPVQLEALDGLYDTFDEETAAAVQAALSTALANGMNPLTVAPMLVDAISPNRANLIARTEMLGAYRDAQLAMYRANSDVVQQWMWSAAGANTCAACMFMDGSLHDLDEGLNSHPSCRCAMLPVTRPWHDILGPLGIDFTDVMGTDITVGYEDGMTWFLKQSDAVQRDMLGPAKYNAWDRLDLHLTDLVGRDESGAVYERSLKELGLDFRDYLERTTIERRGAESDLFGMASRPGGGVDPVRRAFERLPNVDGIGAELRDRWPGLDVEFAGLDAQTVNRLAETFDALAERWPEAAERLDYFGVDIGPRAEQIFADMERPGATLPARVNAAADPNGTFFLLNIINIAEPAELEADLAQDIAVGFHPEGADRLEFVVAHEMGHVVEAWIRTDAERAELLDAFEAEHAEMRATLGRYAADSPNAPQEAFAHAWAANEMGILVDNPYVQEQADFLEQLLADHPGTGDVAVPFPGLGSDIANLRPLEAGEQALTREALADKSMVELRQVAREMGVPPARTKAETIDRILAKQAEKTSTPLDRAATLRTELDERIARRELLYGQQHDLLEEQSRLEMEQQRAAHTIEYAEHRARIELYHESLDKSDPAVKQYLKNIAAHDKAVADQAAAQADMKRLEREMDRLSIQGKQYSQEFAQARSDYNQAKADFDKATQASRKAWGKLWEQSRSVYKPETDSIAGFEYKLRDMGLTFRQEDIAAKVASTREQITGIDARLAEIRTELQGLERPMRAINREVDRYLAQLRDLGSALPGETLDAMRPFNAAIDLPEGHQPPNAMMNKLDYRMREPRAVTKGRIIDDIAARLQQNPVWRDYVERMPRPDNLGIYHQYVHVVADARDTKSAQLVADIVRRWGVGYRPGNPDWVAMQMAVREEFGLDAVLHATSAAEMRAGEAVFAENGPALQAFMRAMYDNTQQWFADHGITEVDVYRGLHWAERDAGIPVGLSWGPIDSPSRGIMDYELNPFQSFSADINISAGTTQLGGFGGGFSDRGDYRLLVGARVPVDRVLSTAQSGFGAKLESEIVVMGRASDTVAYRASTRIEAALLQRAEEQVIGDGIVYTLADGTMVRVEAGVDGAFTVTYVDGPQAKLGTMKVGASRTYKTVQGVNRILKTLRVANVYAP
jgi:hypothetical protein